MEAATAAALAYRGSVLALHRPADKARARFNLPGGVVPGPAARRRPLVVSLSEPPSAHSLDSVAVARETLQVDDDLVSPEILPPLVTDVHAKTVQVKFVLRKQCAFGQHFLVVGDVPALGLWDPAKASALDWSEGHIWTVKKDLPANKLIEFKFLLQDWPGQVRWQHGSNRILQITETSNTLVVNEDWDDAKCQKVSEEAHLSIGEEGVIFSASNGAWLADEHQLYENDTNNGVTNVSVYGEKTSSVVADASMQYEDPKITDEVSRKANVSAQNSNPPPDAAATQYVGSKGEDSISYEEGAAVEIRPASMFENDMVWIRKALQRLLRRVRFQIGTTKTWHKLLKLKKD